MPISTVKFGLNFVQPRACDRNISRLAPGLMPSAMAESWRTTPLTREARSAVSLDPAAKSDVADRLADLDADCSVRARHNTRSNSAVVTLPAWTLKPREP